MSWTYECYSYFLEDQMLRDLPWRPWLPSPNRDDELVIGMEPTVDIVKATERES